ncbi:MAG: hypothetical protein LBT09_10660 [Planctomycetaceae bacterium]|nr:hypothetical protein [Planctomycetaceae bacterium]
MEFCRNFDAWKRGIFSGVGHSVPNSIWDRIIQYQHDFQVYARELRKQQGGEFYSLEYDDDYEDEGDPFGMFL